MLTVPGLLLESWLDSSGQRVWLWGTGVVCLLLREGFIWKIKTNIHFSFKDLAMYINEVKRDKETLKKISEFQSSIENLVSWKILLLPTLI